MGGNHLYHDILPFLAMTLEAKRPALELGILDLVYIRYGGTTVYALMRSYFFMDVVEAKGVQAFERQRYSCPQKGE